MTEMGFNVLSKLSALANYLKTGGFFLRMVAAVEEVVAESIQVLHVEKDPAEFMVTDAITQEVLEYITASRQSYKGVALSPRKHCAQMF